MLLRYNGFDLLPGRTVNYEIRPVFDPSGLDLLYQEIDLSVIATLNPAMFATGKPGAPTGIAGIGVQGDRADQTFFAIRQALMTPRKQLLLDLGPSRIHVAPRPFADGTVPPCDPSGGPFPQECRFLSVVGDKTISLLYRVKFSFSDCVKTLLSHRWSVRSEIDTAGYTTREITGRAIFRLDYLEANVPRALADQFRSVFAHPLPDGMRRDDINVGAKEDGTELAYRVIDKEMEWNLGSNSPAYKVEGVVTTGVDCPIKDYKGAISKAADVFGAPFAAAKAAASFDPAGAAKALMGPLASILPVPKVTALCRVYGRPGADRAVLLEMGVNFIIDRLNPLTIGGNLWPCSFYATQSFGTEQPPCMEVRAEFLAANGAAMKSIFNPGGAARMQNLTRETIDSGAYSLKTDPAWKNPIPPLASGLRGRWAGNLLIQTLMSGCDLPGNPPPAPDPKTTFPRFDVAR